MSRWLPVPGGARVPVALGLWVVILYGGSLGTGFHYDDAHSLVDNPSIRSLANAGRFFVDPGTFSAMPEARMYRPLVLLSYALNHAVGGTGAAGYHLVNVLLHALNACLVWWLARTWLVGSRGALGAALLFATHPLLSEPVNYVSSRSESMAAACVLAGAIVAGRLCQRPGWRQHLWLTAAAAAALACKATGIALLPLVAWSLWLRRAPRSAWTVLAGPALAAATYLALTWTIIGKAVVAAPVRGWGAQAGTQMKALAFYLQTAVLPVRLSVEPQFAVAHGALSPVPLLGLALAASLAAVIVVLRRRAAAPSGPPVMLFAGGWILLTLAPTSVVPLNILVNEHRLYLPMVGAALAGGLLLTRGGAWPRRLAPVLLLLWAVLVLQRHGAWRSEEGLWADAIAKGPAMARPHVNLGKAYLEQGRTGEAIAASRRALALDPTLARAHYNLGTAWLQEGRNEEAVASYERALEIDPRMVEALNNLGTAYQHQGRHARAIEHYREALAVVEHPSIQHNLGSAFLAAGQPDSAAAHFARALELGAGGREVLEGLARAQRRAGDARAALTTLQRALREAGDDDELLELLALAHADLAQDDEALAAYRRAGIPPAEARRRLAGVARRLGQWERARRHLEAGLRAAPEDARLVNALGAVTLARGDAPAALAQFRRAARLDPALAEPFRNIGLVFLQARRPAEALAALERARDLHVEADGADAAGRTWELLARARVLDGDTTAAAAAYERAIALTPGRAELYHNLGRLHEEMGHRREAERRYRQALEGDPALIPALYNLGYVLLESGRYGEAAVLLERLLAEEPDHDLAYVNLADARLGLGQVAAAIGAYERFLELHPSSDATRAQVETQLRRLQSLGPEPAVSPH